MQFRIDSEIDHTSHVTVRQYGCHFSNVLCDPYYHLIFDANNVQYDFSYELSVVAFFNFSFFDGHTSVFYGRK